VRCYLCNAKMDEDAEKCPNCGISDSDRVYWEMTNHGLMLMRSEVARFVCVGFKIALIALLAVVVTIITCLIF